MGFTNVAWESRSAERLARDLTDGPGPTSVGQAGAAWVRVADEWASIAAEFGAVVDKIKDSFSSQGADAAARKLEEFGAWLASVAVSAAGNGERAEQAAVAYSVAVLGMPSVSQVIQARTTHEVMASLAAYNGAVLSGQFAEFDEAVAAHRVAASAVMYQYEEACDGVGGPWPQPAVPDAVKGAALTAEQDAEAEEDQAASAGAGVGGAGAMAAPLAAFRAAEVKSSNAATQSHKAEAAGAAPGTTGMGPAGYGPMAGLARGAGSTREHHSSLAGSVDGGGELGAGVSASDPSWLPATQHSEAPFVVSQVSWDPSTSVFDQLAGPVEPEPPQFADAPAPTLEQVSNRWVSPPVIGADKGLTR
jgi:hypothetical protein